MSDRTSISVMVYLGRDATDEEHAVLEAIKDDYHGSDWGLDGDLSFGIEERVVGSSDELFRRIRQEFPQAIEVVVWEDPAYEWLGTVHRWRADGFEFEGECDSNGSAVLTEHEIVNIDRDTETAEEFRARIFAAVGRPFEKV